MNIKCVSTSVQIGGKKIVNSISFDTDGKKFVGIIGPNGSGKSTLLKCIYRILKPSEGVIYIDNTDLGSLKIQESAKKLAVVAQHNFYNFDFTVQEVVLMGRAPHKRQLERDNAEDYQITQEALEKVEMTDFSQRLFSTLSGGEQQRVLLARALAQKTGCLILDEPTNHLDVKYQLQLLNVVKGLGLTVIAAMHDLNLAAMYCDFIYVLKDGEIKGCGAPKELLTTELLREIYEVDAKITEDEVTGIINIIFKPSYVCGK